MAEFSINRGSATEWAPYFGKARRANGQVGALMLGALGSTKNAKVIPCPAGCGARRMAFDGPHGPHFIDGVLVDCRGREVPRG